MEPPPCNRRPAPRSGPARPKSSADELDASDSRRKGLSFDSPNMKDVITGQDVQAIPPGGELSTGLGAIVTPWARELAATRGIRIVQAPAAPGAVVVAIGADHGGFPMKEQIKAVLTGLGYRFTDLGAYSTDPVDYPDIALAVARAVKSGEAGLGILVDGAGIGSAMAANKVPGVRAAVCVNEAAAR